MSLSSDGAPVPHDTVEVSVPTLRQRIAEVLSPPEWSADDGRHLISGVADLTPGELGELHPFALADTEAMERRHDRRIDLVVALRRRLDEARYGPGTAAATLERLASAARYDRPGPAATVATAVGVLERCSKPDDPAVTSAAVHVLAAVHRVLEDREVLDAPDRSSSSGTRAGRRAPSGSPPSALRRGTGSVNSATMPWDQPLNLATLAALPGAQAAWPDAGGHIRDAATSPWDASYRSMLTRQQ